MTLRIDRTIGPFYCQSALRMCIEARKLCEKGNCKKAAELCSYISTLCSENSFETCYQESLICKKVAVYCQTGHTSEECRMARTACNEAKRLCPRNNMVSGG